MKEALGDSDDEGGKAAAEEGAEGAAVPALSDSDDDAPKKVNIFVELSGVYIIHFDKFFPLPPPSAHHFFP